MSVFNQSRSRIIRLIFGIAILVITGQLFYLQVISKKYGQLARNNAILERTVYPPRGLVFVRKNQAFVNNTLTHDLMVTPAQIRSLDTTFFCSLMEIDTAEFRNRIITAIIKNSSQKPSVFEASLPPAKYARIEENLWRFQNGFYIQDRPIRSYPFKSGANIVGFLGEVDSNYLKRHTGEGYVSGDYAGLAGLESSYEKALMGERGSEVLIRDKFGRIQGPYENGELDKKAVAGKNLYTSIDIDLQMEGEKLMHNKVGSIVAIDPKTGGILCMVSSPTYDPNYLTGADRSRHVNELMYNDPRLPTFNRAVSATYSPGSTFKTLQALVGLHEGVITPTTTFGCSGAFYGCGGGKPMKCLDPGTYYLKTAITFSCNTYFANVMQRVITNPKFPSADSALRSWDRYMYGFGLGHKLGVDIPSEQKGNIPAPEGFNKIYGAGHWNFCTYRSVSIGQGEVNVTPLQVANEMAYIANKGFYYIPHIVDSIEGGDEFGLLERFKKKNSVFEIPDSVFEYVHDGMQGVMEVGTGRGAKVPGINVCGKTGTVENYFRGVKQPNHSFFAAFAPRENPRIAIMCVVENSGRFGGTYAAPITSLMIEKYLNDTISTARKALETRMSEIDLIPPLMMQKIRSRDSLQRAREQARAEKEAAKEAAKKNMNGTQDARLSPAGDQPAGQKPGKDSATKPPVKPAINVPVDPKKMPAPRKDITR